MDLSREQKKNHARYRFSIANGAIRADHAVVLGSFSSLPPGEWSEPFVGAQVMEGVLFNLRTDLRGIVIGATPELVRFEF
jgi:hypothetical protein